MTAAERAARERGLTGAGRIAAERLRQVAEEGFDDGHDDEYVCGELALAAALFATPELLYADRPFCSGRTYRDPWPWSECWDTRPHDGNVPRANSTLSTADRIRQLEKAGALIAAEIDRLLREAATS